MRLPHCRSILSRSAVRLVGRLAGVGMWRTLLLQDFEEVEDVALVTGSSLDDDQGHGVEHLAIARPLVGEDGHVDDARLRLHPEEAHLLPAGSGVRAHLDDEADGPERLVAWPPLVD